MILYGAEGLTARDQAHRLLALAAAEHWGLSPLPALDRAEHGKPFFPGLPERQFNLSHSGPLALCALDRRPVGVDIQTVGPHRPRILQRVCSREERAWLDEQSDLWAAFAQLWALKESRAKYTGAGLTSPIAEIRVPLPAPGVLTLDGLHFRVYSGPGWRAAACATGNPPTPRRQRPTPPRRPLMRQSCCSSPPRPVPTARSPKMNWKRPVLPTRSWTSASI